MASPFTNFMAPSMAPKSWLSFSTSPRRRLASSRSMVPARMSASMHICLPGMASSEKRAATSATRSAPLVIDDELHDGDDQEDHHADHEIAADDEVAEGVDDVAGVAVQQDQPGRADAERQPEQRGDEQDRRERGECKGDLR